MNAFSHAEERMAAQMLPPTSSPTSAHAPAPPLARSLGAILIDRGRLTPQDAEAILHLQKKQGLRFGEAAIALGLLTPDDLQQALASQFDYPYLPVRDATLSRDLVAAYEPHSRAVEMFRALRSQLMLRWFDAQADRKRLAVVSTAPGEGRSHIAANLAIVFSQLGERTLLIDADLRAPRQHRLFKLPNRVGLAEMLTGRAGPEALVSISSLVGLTVLPAGASPPNPQELVARPAFAALLPRLAEDFDVVILDTPPAGRCADALTVASKSQAALIVARKNHSPAHKAGELARQLQDFGTTVVGTVLNDA